MVALSKPSELKAIAPMITWPDPDDGLWTRGGAIELGLTVPGPSCRAPTSRRRPRFAGPSGGPAGGHFARKARSAVLTSSAWVHSSPCGAPSIST
ncbi:hypothetical protein [Streptomyces sp. NPDC096132]|uniref:hypothetical protein n=1 Tax=Streptomyces sp. NPDC096132 TaxID=3366075 RepID=UPI00382C77FA